MKRLAPIFVVSLMLMVGSLQSVSADGLKGLPQSVKEIEQWEPKQLADDLKLIKPFIEDTRDQPYPNDLLTSSFIWHELFVALKHREDIIMKALRSPPYAATVSELSNVLYAAHLKAYEEILPHFYRITKIRASGGNALVWQRVGRVELRLRNRLSHYDLMRNKGD